MSVTSVTLSSILVGRAERFEPRLHGLDEVTGRTLVGELTASHADAGVGQFIWNCVGHRRVQRNFGRGHWAASLRKDGPLSALTRNRLIGRGLPKDVTTGSVSSLGTPTSHCQSQRNGVIESLMRPDKNNKQFEAFRNAQVRWLPLLRLGVPEDVAGVASFLASDPIRDIKGAVVQSASGIRDWRLSPLPRPGNGRTQAGFPYRADWLRSNLKFAVPRT